MKYIGRRVGKSQTTANPQADGNSGGILDLFSNGYFQRTGNMPNYVASSQGLTATGGVISDYTDPGPGTVYRAHIFTSSGTFSVSSIGGYGSNVEYLVVAGGGGGGGGTGGGGGGAGGLLYHPSYPVSTSPGIYTITIGAGGSRTPAAGASSSGTSTTVSNPGVPTMTALGGGPAGGGDANAGATGGSGGGSSGGGAGAFGPSSPGTQSPYTGNGTATGYANAGGRGYHNPNNFVNGGGGGGAGAAGGDSVTSNWPQPRSNSGGNGREYTLHAGPTQPAYFAAGGGGGGHYLGSTAGNGGLGGAGGGGANNPFGSAGGSGFSAGSDGTTNSTNAPGGDAGYATGSGGGGAGGSSGGTGGAGGSGIVVVRYQIGQLTAVDATPTGSVKKDSMGPFRSRVVCLLFFIILYLSWRSFDRLQLHIIQNL